MFNDAKIASLIKRNTRVLGQYDNGIAYICINGHVAYQIPNWGDYPKTYGKLFSTGKMCGNNDFTEKGNVKQFFETDLSYADRVKPTGISVVFDNDIQLYNVSGKDVLAVNRTYAETVTADAEGWRNPDKPYTIYYTDSNKRIFGVITVVKTNVEALIRQLLPSVWQQINKAIDYNNPGKVGDTQ